MDQSTDRPRDRGQADGESRLSEKQFPALRDEAFLSVLNEVTDDALKIRLLEAVYGPDLISSAQGGSLYRELTLKQHRKTFIGSLTLADVADIPALHAAVREAESLGLSVREVIDSAVNAIKQGTWDGELAEWLREQDETLTSGLKHLGRTFEYEASRAIVYSTAFNVSLQPDYLRRAAIRSALAIGELLKATGEVERDIESCKVMEAIAKKVDIAALLRKEAQEELKPPVVSTEEAIGVYIQRLDGLLDEFEYRVGFASNQCTI